MFLAVYVQLDYDRHQEPGSRLTMRGADTGSPVHLCGPPADSFAAAEALARDTINTATEHRRPHLLPRVFAYRPGEALLDVGDRAEQWFIDKIAQMNEADITMG